MAARRVLWVILRGLLRVICLLAFRLRVFGQNNVPRRGGVLLVSNHQSYLDPILVGLGLDRSVSYMARKTLFRNRWFGLLIRWCNAFPVDRDERDVSAVREAVDRLRDGWCLVVFPEGTRCRDGEIAPFRHGALAIADRVEAAIVPAVVEGAFEAWPRGRWPWPHPIRVAYGRPITAAERATMTRDEAVERLRNDMLALQRQLRQTKM